MATKPLFWLIILFWKATMQIIDITAELNDRVKCYKNDPRVHLEEAATIESDGYALTKLTLGSHSGTHVDAQCHYEEDGQTAAEIPLSLCIGRCFVVDAADFKVPANAKRVLVKGNTENEFTLNSRQARALMDAGVRLIGTDGLSIGSDEVHQILLKEKCVVLELLDLSKAAPGPYTLCAMPLKIACDGAPVRACLLDSGQAQRE